ncbi:hypothetical protein NBRC110019_16750 [Neptunitalea chrysea]|uniref:Uncharacterized protein n=2 Tax=Neptunitalea chrysea TaxID=1647581 RepID=A0A9W6B6T6_9FLAO|nr:hypothetical protein NBRC110019_16750 [Neptunitalea chrysea]
MDDDMPLASATFDLSANIDVVSGMGKINISMLDNGTYFRYEDAIIVNSCVNIYYSDSDFATFVAQGGIGANN